MIKYEIMVDRKIKHDLLNDIVFYLKLGNTDKDKRKLEKLYWEYKKKGFTSKVAWEKATRNIL